MVLRGIGKMRKVLVLLLAILCTDIADKDLRNLCEAETKDDVSLCQNIENKDLQEFCYDLFK